MTMTDGEREALEATAAASWLAEHSELVVEQVCGDGVDVTAHDCHLLAEEQRAAGSGREAISESAMYAAVTRLCERKAREAVADVRSALGELEGRLAEIEAYPAEVRAELVLALRQVEDAITDAHRVIE